MNARTYEAAALLERAFGPQFRLSQLKMLSVCYSKPGISMTSLAKACGLSLAAISRSVERRPEWFITNPDPDDRRITEVYLKHRVQAQLIRLEELFQ